MKITNLLLAAILVALLANLIFQKPAPIATPAVKTNSVDAEKRWRDRLARIDKEEGDARLIDGATLAQIDNDAARRLVSRPQAAAESEKVVASRLARFEALRRKAFEEELLARLLDR